MKDNAPKIGTVIANLRTARGITQSEVASSLGISDKTLSKWENGASSPTPEMISALARYFEVSADTLLGLNAAGGIDITDEMVRQILAAGRSGGIRQMFDLTHHMVQAYYSLLSDDKNDGVTVMPEIRNEKYSRSLATSKDMFAMQVNSKKTNLFTMLLGSEENFSFLTDADKAESISALLTLLADADAMRLIAVIHHERFPANFSLSFISEKSGIDESTCEAILHKFCKIGLCHSYTAHLAEGDKMVYSSYGDGMILTVLSLCYEFMFGENSNCYYYGGGCKMIR